MGLATARAEDFEAANVFVWALHNGIRLQGGSFVLAGHEYQVDALQSTARVVVYKKAAQLGFTEVEVLRVLHGMIYKKYSKGVLYLFPTSRDVSEFSKARFTPLINTNFDAIGRWVQDTDTDSIKRIKQALLYLRGARSTTKVEGLKKDSSKLRSIPVDKLVFDEEDLMDPDMVDLALERVSHSDVKEEVHISTPTIPGFGIDAQYDKSTQHKWFIRCESCGRDCCLEDDFPDCVQSKAGAWVRVCISCGRTLNPSDGRWIASYPSREIEGRYISQLCSHYVNPGTIKQLWLNPPHGNLQEVENSKLGRAYIAAQNRLTVNDVYACCGQDGIAFGDRGPCAMGVDVGDSLHVVIGRRLPGIRKKIVYVGRVKEFSDLHDLATNFNVKFAVIDQYPETRKVREFRKAEAVNQRVVLGCQYLDRSDEELRENEDAGLVKVARTELCDATHTMIVNGVYELPRRCPEIEEYAKGMAATAKVLEVDDNKGIQVYRYKKLGADHYRHATNYCELALNQLPEWQEPAVEAMLERQRAAAEAASSLRHLNRGR